MKIFCSDLHFGHKRIVEFTNRGIECNRQDNHTTWLVNLWNKQVSDGDVVYHLGDFSFFTKYEKVAEVVSNLKGNKIFIKGNHDRSEHFDKLVHDRLISAWFDYKEIKLGEMSVVLFHYPVAAWNKQGRGSWHLHGHCHGNFKESKGKMLDVGLDSSYNLYGKHKFFTEQDIEEYMNLQQVHVTDHHKIL
jgi:calcineurin-like phosphoesterase family protein